MMSLKEIAFSNNPEHERGVSPIVSLEDVGKYVLVYKKENTLVRGTRPYDTKEQAQEILKLIDQNLPSSEVVIKRISEPQFESKGRQ